MTSTVGICGLGLIGSSAARGLLAAGDTVIGTDRDAATLAAAERLGVRPISALDDLGECDVILLAAPTSTNSDLLVELLRRGVRVPTADIGSVKGPIRAAWLATDADFPFVGTHPMAGSHWAGFEAGSPDLFTGAVWPVVVDERTDPVALLEVLDLIARLGALATPMSAPAHDRAVALASHVPHALAGALGETVADAAGRDLVLLLAAGSFRDTTRVTSSPPDRTAEYLVQNGAEVGAALRDVAARLTAMADELARGDEAAIAEGFERARAVRRQFERRTERGEPHTFSGDARAVRAMLLAVRDTGLLVVAIEGSGDDWRLTLVGSRQEPA